MILLKVAAIDLANTMSMKSKALQGLIKKIPAHLVINSLHVKLDGHEAMIDQSSPKVMHKLLCNQDIIKNTMHAHKGALLQD